MTTFKKQILLLFLFVFLIPFRAAGIEYQGLGGAPAYPDPADPKTLSWFIYYLPTESKKQDGVVIVNNTPQEVAVLVYPQDSIKSSDGGFALKQFGDTRETIGRWVKLYEDPPEVLATTTPEILQICDKEKQKPEKRQREEVLNWCEGKESIEVTLLAFSNKVVPFIISIPEQIDVGEHTGAILIQKKEPETADQQGQGGILISTRVGVRIYETVPGEIIKNLTLTKFEVVWNKERHVIQATIAIQNSGNASADTVIKFIVDDPFFSKNRMSIERTPEVLRDDELVTNFDIGEPKIGILKFIPEISYLDGQGNLQHIPVTPMTLWIVPWVEVAASGVGLVLVVSAGIVYWRLRKKRYSTTGWVDYKVKKGETITELAHNLGVSWRILAKANGINPPFVLEAGQKIKLPPPPVKTGDQKTGKKNSKSLKVG